MSVIRTSTNLLLAALVPKFTFPNPLHFFFYSFLSIHHTSPHYSNPLWISQYIIWTHSSNCFTPFSIRFQNKYQSSTLFQNENFKIQFSFESIFSFFQNPNDRSQNRIPKSNIFSIAITSRPNPNFLFNTLNPMIILSRNLTNLYKMKN